MHCSSQQRDLLDQESLLATSCPIVRVSQKVATSIGKLYYVQCTILLWRTSIAPASHLTNILISQDEAKVMVISNSYVKLCQVTLLLDLVEIACVKFKIIYECLQDIYQLRV